jgi:hypothetical protein
MIKQQKKVKKEIVEAFPGLLKSNYEILAAPSLEYNSAAWAAGESHRPWSPTGGGYWPPEATRKLAVESFVEAFQTLGYQLNKMDASFDADFEKVAIFAKEGEPSQFSRQLRNGKWATKLGIMGPLIQHDDLKAIEGNLYGRVVAILQRPWTP